MKSLNFSRIARTLVVVCAASLATVAPVLVASPAQAASGETHCMIVLPDTTIVRCFDTHDEAKQFAESHGGFGTPKGDAGTAQAARSVASAAVTLTLIGVEYELPFWAGSSVWVYGTAGPCTTPVTNIDYQLADWGLFGFDQKISSFRTFNNCWAKHYDLVNFGGLAVGYQGSQLVINAALDKDTSSERWS